MVLTVSCSYFSRCLSIFERSNSDMQYQRRSLGSLNSHVFSFIPGFVNPRWSHNGGPHAHCQLREGQIRTTRAKRTSAGTTVPNLKVKQCFACFFRQKCVLSIKSQTNGCRDKTIAGTLPFILYFGKETALVSTWQQPYECFQTSSDVKIAAA